jgi:hypothetical protein
MGAVWHDSQRAVFLGSAFSGTAVNVTAAADFFTTDVWTWRGVVTFCKVPVIDLACRCAQ